MTDIDEIRSPFVLKNIQQRGVIGRPRHRSPHRGALLRPPELTNSVAALMLRAAIKDHPLEAGDRES